jgi:hypothetical protein
MKELQQHNQKPEEQEVVKPIRHQVDHLANMQPKPGQSIFFLDRAKEYDLLQVVIANKSCTKEQKAVLLKNLDIVGKIKESDFEKTVRVEKVGRQKVTHKKLITKKHCMYVAALNTDNAIMKFLKMLSAI